MNTYVVELRNVIDNPNKILPDIKLFITNEAKNEHDINYLIDINDDLKMMVNRVFSEKYTYVYSDEEETDEIKTKYMDVEPGDENYVKAASYNFKNYGTRVLVQPIV